MEPLNGESIADALKQLNQSERGHAAAVQLRKFLESDDGYPLGLDQNNWRALVTLLRACERGAAHKVRDLLPKR